MRTIKFRGQRVDTKKWVYGHYWFDHFRKVWWISLPKDTNNDKDGCNFQVIPETVGQFTGAPDKYGSEIYEGNIVRIYNDDDDEVGIVVWDDSEHRWNIEQGNIVFELGSFYPRELEVIGNIHDNTELLK